MKVACICHFSNSEIRDLLALENRGNYRDFAPWITNLIREFEKIDDVQLHVISPHAGLKKTSCELVLRGVHYYFYKPELPFKLSAIANRFTPNSAWQFFRNRRYIKRVIAEQKFDIINLWGSENPYYSIASLDVKDIPVYVIAQTVYTNPARIKIAGMIEPLRWQTELKIHKKERYYGVSGRMHRDLIYQNNNDAIFFKITLPIILPQRIEAQKRYDFGYFAVSLTQKKGIEDAIEALAIVKKDYPNVTMTAVGRCNDNYMSCLTDMVKRLGLTENIYFAGSFEKHCDMVAHISQSKYALLPLKLDIISGTILEAMALGLPVLTYQTSGTPYLNREKECVLIAPSNDIRALAENMKRVLAEKGLAEKLEQNASQYIEDNCNNSRNAQIFVEQYRAIIDHYREGKEIDRCLLFDLNEFPLYE